MSGLEPRAHVRQPHVAVPIALGRRHAEARAGERCVPMLVDGDVHRGRKSQAAERSPQAVRQLRPGVEQRRREHVARDPAHRVEV